MRAILGPDVSRISKSAQHGSRCELHADIRLSHRGPILCDDSEVHYQAADKAAIRLQRADDNALR